MPNPCPNCGSDQTKVRENVADDEFHDPSHVSTHRCTDCSFRFDPSSDSYGRWVSGQTSVSEKADE